MASVKELIKSLRSVSNNENQIARRCNEIRSIYGEGVENLQKRYVQVRKEMALLVGRFAKL